MKKIAIAAAALASAVATPAFAGPTITSIQVKNIDGLAGNGFLQIAELELFSGTTDVALQSNGGVASATSVYSYGGDAGQAVPGHANDGSLNAFYPNLYHGNADDGSDIFTLTLPKPTEIDSISIYGRSPNDCCSFRDIYSYTLFNGESLVGSGTLDARGTGMASVTLGAVPEPATWAMMLLGFGMIGFGMRYRRKSTKVSFA